MLDLGKERTIEWTTVFADHSDPYTYWYLPNHVSLDTYTVAGSSNPKPVFQMIEYTGGEGEPKGAFVNFQVRLELPKLVEGKIKSRIGVVFSEWIDQCRDNKKLRNGEPDSSNVTLSVAPWKGGTVECVSFDKSSLRVEPAAGASESEKPETKTATFSFTQSIQGSVTPSLDAKNTAIFGLHLSRAGAELMRATLENPMDTMPIGIIYQLKYIGMTPSYKAHITANMSQVYKHLSLRAAGQKKLIKVGITAGLEELKRQDVIKIDIDDFLPGENKALEATIMSILQEKIINEWMKPVLTPGELKGMVQDPESLDTVIGRDKARKEDKGDENKIVLRVPPRVGDPPDEEDNEEHDEDDDPPPPPPDDEIPPPPPDDDDVPPPPEDDPEDRDPDDPDPEDPEPEDPTPDKTPDNSTPEIGKIVDGLIPKVAGGAVISFELKAIQQTELRQFTFDLNKREAQQRSFCPQQFLTNLLATEMTVWKDPEKKTNEYLQRVVFDSAFFDSFPIKVYGPEEGVYPAAAMKAATVTLRYPRSSPKDTEQTKVFPFTKAVEASAIWQPHLEGPTFGYNVEYVFQDNLTSGWLSKGGKTSYSYKFDNISGRTVNASLNELQFIQCEIAPGPDNWGNGFKTATVEMRYPPGGSAPPADSVPPKTFTVTEASTLQLYRLRVDSKDPISYEYRVTHKNGPRSLVSLWMLSEPGSTQLMISGPSLVPLRFGVGALAPAAIQELRLTVNATDYVWKEQKILRGDPLVRAVDAGEVVFDFPVPPGHADFKCSWEAEIKWKKPQPSMKIAEQSEGWTFDVEVAVPEEQS
ncbi:hypothetical protein [Acidicapsa acidisoli]|uniref:hypothetical protein n=1 Tax=Acidicapsa acidisoli TaxID=1615681 RepID=UPI0021DFD20D|nr:hypothetical protein [Acidicapsa acidisoli]